MVLLLRKFKIGVFMSRLRGRATNAILGMPAKVTGHSFFNPYESPSDFLTRTAAIATTPVLGVIHVAQLVIEIAVELIQGAINLITFNFSGAAGNFLSMGLFLLSALAVTLVYAVSPVIELVDLVGGGINSCL